jgi:hypothetical protein
VDPVGEAEAVECGRGPVDAVAPGDVLVEQRRRDVVERRRRGSRL